MRSVVIVQEIIPEYRLEFFRSLENFLTGRGVNLTVVCSRPSGSMAARRNTTHFGNAVVVDKVGLGPFVWQQAWRLVSTADLVIVEQANRHVITYLLLIYRAFGGPRVAFWGHGRNRQAHRRQCRELIKRWMVTWPDWWFAYTKGTAEYVSSLGFADERICTVQNSFDAVSLYKRPMPADKVDYDCIYIGGLYEAKRIKFLVESARIAHQSDGRFVLNVIGDGPLRSVVESYAKYGVRYLGAQFGEEKANRTLESKLFLHPGAVGLSVLDAMAAGTPMVTIDADNHGPEIEYLRDGVSGRVMRKETTTTEYAAEVVRLLQYENERRAYASAGATAIESLSVSTMVDNFGGGVIAALGELAR